MTGLQEREAFAPDWGVHPGEVLEERLEVYGMRQADLSRRTGLSTKLVSEIINGKNPITAESAIALGHVLGLAPIVWANLQCEWDLFEVRRRATPDAGRIAALISRLPIAELVGGGILPKGLQGAALLERVLTFFGVASLEAYEARLSNLAVKYRRSPKFESSPDHVHAWLQIGEVTALGMGLPAFDRIKFERYVRHEIRALTMEPPEVFWPQMVSLCHEAGVALVLSRPFAGTKLSGAARWLDSGNAVILLSLRHKTNDHFWWTFFHESGHVVRHPKKNFADDGDAKETSQAEIEANSFAEDVLVGKEKLGEFASSKVRAEHEVREIANKLKLHPAIVLGMLQHRGAVHWSRFNALKIRLEFADPQAK